MLNDEQRREMDPNAELPEYEKRNYFFPVEFFNVGSHILLRSGMDDMYLYRDILWGFICLEFL